MTDPTPELVDEARVWLAKMVRLGEGDPDKVGNHIAEMCSTILAALEAAEKERDTEIAKWKVRTHEVEAILSRIIDHYEYDAEECARFRGKACGRCQDIIDAKNLLRLQHIDTATLRDLETTKEQ